MFRDEGKCFEVIGYSFAEIGEEFHGRKSSSYNLDTYMVHMEAVNNS